MCKAIQGEDLTGKHFLSIDTSGHVGLSGLKATSAWLRHANFQEVNFEGAHFNGANLTNTKDGRDAAGQARPVKRLSGIAA